MPEPAVMSMWTLYDHPTDHPDGYIARRWEIHPGEARPTDDIITGASTLEISDQLPDAGLHWLPRQPGDDPKILGVWL